MEDLQSEKNPSGKGGLSRRRSGAEGGFGLSFPFPGRSGQRGHRIPRTEGGFFARHWKVRFRPGPGAFSGRPQSSRLPPPRGERLPHFPLRLSSRIRFRRPLSPGSGHPPRFGKGSISSPFSRSFGSEGKRRERKRGERSAERPSSSRGISHILKIGRSSRRRSSGRGGSARAPSQRRPPIW